MARDRQQAKQRQAERRARRLAQQEGGRQRSPTQSQPSARETSRDDAPLIDPDLAAGAPPQAEGRSDSVIDDEPDFDDDDDEHLTEEEVEAEEEAEARARRPRRGGLRGARPPRRLIQPRHTRTARVSYSS